MLSEISIREQVRNAGLELFGYISRRSTGTRLLPVASPRPRNVLVIRPDHLGDLLFATPALSLLRQAQPQARITMLVGPWGREVVAGNPDVDEVMTCDFPWFNRRRKRSPWEPYTLLRKMASELAGHHFDVALNLRFDFWWGAAVAHLAGIPEVIGYDQPGCHPFLTCALPYVPRCHEVEQNLRLVSTLVDKGSPLVREARTYPLRYRPSADDDRWVDELLGRTLRCESGPLLGIHPGAGAPVKLWTAHGFAEVARRLVRGFGGAVVITGSAAERELAQDIADRLGAVPAEVLAGETSLGQLSALFARCSLVIGVDSGPLHLAVAVGTPTVHLFGPSDPAAFGPYGDASKHAIVSAELPCSPCGRLDIAGDELERHTCMLAIQPEQVISAAEGILTQTGRSQGL